MKIIKNKINKIGLLGLLSFVLFVGIVSAAGVASPYWNQNPLKLAPGESTAVKLTLQNMVGDKDKNFRAEITGDWASLLNGSEYFVPFGAEVPFYIQINVPETAEIGQTKKIQILFKEISEEEGGMLDMVGAITSHIPVQVVGEEESLLYEPPQPKESSSAIIWLVLGVLIVILVVFALRKKKDSKKK